MMALMLLLTVKTHSFAFHNAGVWAYVLDVVALALAAVIVLLVVRFVRFLRNR